MKKKLRKDNRGFSLIELIVAVLIMAIIGSVAVVAFGSIFSTKTMAAAKNIQDSLKQARVNALSKVGDANHDGTPDVYAKFYVDGSDLVVDVISTASGSEGTLNNRTIASDNYTIEFYDKTDTLITSLGKGSTDSLRLYFKKSTGGISMFSAGTLPDYIRVIGPGGDSYDVVLVTLTGRSYTSKNIREVS